MRRLLSSKKLLIVVTGTVILLLTLVSPAQADRMDSDNYTITFGNFNVTSGKKTDGVNFTLTDTVGQIANGPYGEYGSSSFFVGSGFQYIYQINEFSFTITDVTIDLGTVLPNTHNTATHDLIVNTKGAGGYVVYAFEAHPLRHSTGSFDIPDTSCDASNCTISSANVWTNTSIPGFGFNMTGDDISADFINSTYFRPFADQESADAMQPVMESANVAEDRTSTVTYKVGVDVNQAAGDYQTNINYVAVPGY